VTLIAEKPRIVVRAPDLIGHEVEPVVLVLPTGNEACHIFVDRDIWIRVDGAPNRRKIPSATVVRVPEVRKIERCGRRHDKEVSDARTIVDVPVRGTWEEEPVVALAPRVVILRRRGRVQ
jgi:hypothetical protein